MIEIVKYNDDNLKDDEIDEVVTRVKVFIISSKNNILIGYNDDGFQLIGGNIKEGEDLINAVANIIFNETGIELDSKDSVEPFYEVRYYTRDYKGTGKNRLSDLIYFCVKSDKLPNLKKLKLTDKELASRMTLEVIRRSEFASEISEYINNEPNQLNKIKGKEILLAFDKFKEIYKF
ncbi:MAG: NUDIX domain-containing protein [Christensenellales bacterium]